MMRTRPLHFDLLGLALLAFAGLLGTYAVAADADLLVASVGTDNVLRYDGRSGEFVGEFIPTGSGDLGRPVGLYYSPDEDLFISCIWTDAVYRYDGHTGEFVSQFVASGSGGLEDPYHMLTEPDGSLLVYGFSNEQINRYAADTGVFLDHFITFEPGEGGFAMIYDSDGNILATGEPNTIRRYDGQTGEFIDVFVPSGSGGLWSPTDMTFGPDGNLYVSSSWNGCVIRYDGGTGEFVDVFVPPGSGGLSMAMGLTFGPDGNLYVAGISGVTRYDGQTGDFIDTFAPPGSGGLDWAAALRFMPAIQTPGDVDGDGDVDLADLAALLAAYGTCEGDPGYNPDADFTGDGCVDLSDLATLLANYGFGPAPVPPPTADPRVEIGATFTVGDDADLENLSALLRLYRHVD